MSKAEDRALEVYPKDIKEFVDVNGLKSAVDNNSWQRTIFLKGYHQAEKDLTDKAKVSSGWDGFYYGQGYKQAEKDLKLTWEDLATLEKLGDDFVKNNQTPMSDKEYYEEILKRFNKERKEK